MQVISSHMHSGFLFDRAEIFDIPLNAERFRLPSFGFLSFTCEMRIEMTA